MPFTVEDGTGLSNANSYLSVADADTYHSDLNQTGWTGTDSVKEAALRKATTYIDNNYSFDGSIVKTTQSLAWPRSSVTDPEGRDLSNKVPTQIKNAVAELALLALTENLVKDVDKSNYVKKEKIGEIEIEYKDSSPSTKLFAAANVHLASIATFKLGGSNINLRRG